MEILARLARDGKVAAAVAFERALPAGGVLVALFLRGSAEGWPQVTMVGTRAGVITAVVLGALLALETVRTPSREWYGRSTHPV